MSSPGSSKAWVPGRLEFIGNHTDYNGGCVLGAAVSFGVSVTVTERPDKCLSLESRNGFKSFTLEDGELTRLSGERFWGNYVIGVIDVLRKNGVAVPGLNIVVDSNLPHGSGLSSSAALELATAFSILSLCKVDIAPLSVAVLCRKAENEFVGVPCGLLDQAVCALGNAGHLVSLDCASGVADLIPLPGDVSFLLFVTPVRHSNAADHYSSRFRECREALFTLRSAFPSIEHLAHASLEQLNYVRERMTEVQFKRACHIIDENQRVAQVRKALERKDLQSLGSILAASHHSSRYLFENSCPELDFLVDRLNSTPGVIGARLSGGGFGGSAMALVDGTFNSARVADLVASFTKTFGTPPNVLSCRASGRTSH